eukprot:CAMPEP_0204096718 /NCGR_PEP_ID=MMETSP0360-20130528/192082_1 /ASSEMBLY_ACC=CAM_ASM_000342 /TAXON_ID=268821 /ORGANISM="Scrippsiella Hangoei, Strain SHTV-5" /LENGTH=158 /DNA_ID=CAMNT_0051046059 /DNA_START=55 /DNA_END=530 /DNA_ORIENTATION=-
MDVDYDEDEGSKPTTRKIKGRGAEDDDRYAGKAGKFERLAHDDDEAGPARSIEGWVIVVSGVHEEAQEDDVFEAFAEFGDIKNLHLNLDRRTGFVKGYAFIEWTAEPAFVKGYAFIEYETKSEAAKAIKGMDGQVLLDQKMTVSWAFTKPSGAARRRR